ncbi:MAG: lipoyl synthase [Nitrosopumilaceae archaeon]
MFIESMSLTKPSWLKMQIPSGENYVKIKKTLQNYNLHTVCEEASCPNVSECWSAGTATIMIMGDICSRGCRFCDVNSGRPLALDFEEPDRVADVIHEWNLRYIVLTSVCRDDLEDEGSDHFAKTIKKIKSKCPNTFVESLIPDFSSNYEFLKKIVNAKPHVISHNLETVKRLSPTVRDPKADYDQSLQVLHSIKKFDDSITTKSSIMLGLGETEDEIFQTGKDLRNVGVDIFTLGQYLQPSLKHLPVKEFIPPNKFNYYKHSLTKMGFLHVESGPLVRSSFRASDVISLIKSRVLTRKI